jgi:hypothetical protein
LSDLYPVNGALEDLLNSFPEGAPVLTYHCDPPTYGRYNITKTDYSLNKDIIKTLAFLLEASNNKHPEVTLLGAYNYDCLVNRRYNAFFNEIKGNNLCQNPLIDGYINKIVRLMLTLVDIAKPYIPMQITDNNDSVKIKWTIGGAITVDETYLAYGYSDVAPDKTFLDNLNKIKTEEELVKLLPSKTCLRTGDAVWGINYGQKDWFEETIPKIPGKHLVVVPFAKVDKQFSKQSNPDPKIPPQSHLYNLRTKHDYFVKNGNFEIHGNDFFMGEVNVR